MQINTHLGVDVVSVEATDTVSLMLELRGPDRAPVSHGPRPEGTTIVVLDRSGSMAGARLAAAKSAVLEVVARLDDRDNFGLVACDGWVDTVVPAGRVGRLGRERIEHAVRGIEARGSSDLAGGYVRALIEAAGVAGPAGTAIVLLSDGDANAGLTDTGRLQRLVGRAAARGVRTATIGIGQGYQQGLLVAMAAGQAGSHTAAADTDAAAAALSGQIGGLMSTSAVCTSILIRPTAEVARVGVFNQSPAEQVDGGLLLHLGDFHGQELRRVLVDLEIPAMAGLGLAQVAELTLSYVELPHLVRHTVTVPVSVNVVPGDLLARRVPSVVVRRERLLQESQQAAVESLTGGAAARQALATAEQLALAIPDSVPAEGLTVAPVAWLAGSRQVRRSRLIEYTRQQPHGEGTDPGDGRGQPPAAA